MADVVDRSDDGDDLVSMHHTLRRSLRKRLKHVAAEIERPVTDIVNEAIEAWLERNEAEACVSGSEIKNIQTAAERIEWLRGLKAAGEMLSAVSVLSKENLITLLAALGQQADRRMSRDRLIGMLARDL